MKESRYLGAFALLIALAFTLPVANAKGSFDEVIAGVSDKKLRKSVNLVKGRRPDKKGQGPVPYLAKLDAPPKRVALVSFYITDSGKQKVRPYWEWWTTYEPGYEVHHEKLTIEVQKFQLTDDASSEFAMLMHQYGVGGLRAGFAEKGMQLLLPPEYLTDDKKSAAYRDFELKEGFGGAFGRMMLHNAVTRAITVSPGYRLFPTHFAPTNPKTADSFDTLRRQLDVDALLVVGSNINYDGKQVVMTSIHMEMFGPNPIAKVEGQRYIGYKDGQNYASANLPLGPKAGWLARHTRKNGFELTTFEGYSRVLDIVGQEVAGFVHEQVYKE